MMVGKVAGDYGDNSANEDNATNRVTFDLAF